MAPRYRAECEEEGDVSPPRARAVAPIQGEASASTDWSASPATDVGKRPSQKSALKSGLRKSVADQPPESSGPSRPSALIVSRPESAARGAPARPALKSALSSKAGGLACASPSPELSSLAPKPPPGPAPKRSALKNRTLPAGTIQAQPESSLPVPPTGPSPSKVSPKSALKRGFTAPCAQAADEEPVSPGPQVREAWGSEAGVPEKAARCGRRDTDGSQADSEVWGGDEGAQKADLAAAGALQDPPEAGSRAWTADTSDKPSGGLTSSILDDDDDRAASWSTRGVCRRVFHRVSQRDLWGPSTSTGSGEVMEQRLATAMQETPGGLAFVRRASTKGSLAAMDGNLMQDVVATDAPPKKSRKNLQRATSIFLYEDGADSLLSAVEAEAPQDSKVDGPAKEGTGASEDPANPAVSADTGGTPAVAGAKAQGPSPLKGLMMAKKIELDLVRKLLETMPDKSLWLDAPLDEGPPYLPPPLFLAVGATRVDIVGLLLEHGADVQQKFPGKSMYSGWIKPGATPSEAVHNRKGRFLGTMLGDRLDAIHTVLKVAEDGASESPKEEEKGADGDDEKRTSIEKVKGSVDKVRDLLGAVEEINKSKQRRKSMKVQTAAGEIEHTQGHPSDKYDVVGELGEGTFSVVKQGMHRGKLTACAIKAEMKVEEGVIWEEIAIMRKLWNPNVIQLLETFEDDSNIFQVLELCAGGELFERLAAEGGLPERDAARIMNQLGGAIQYIHQERVAHRDIQPENFLLKDDKPLNEATVKLIDFTTAKEFGGGEGQSPMKTKICTLHYVAPEILTRKDITYTEKVDIWSLGVVFYVILSGAPPFHGSSEVEILKRIKKANYKFEPEAVWKGIHKNAKDLIQRMLVVDVAERFSADDVSSHAFLNRDFDGGSRKSVTQNILSVDQMQSLRNFHARNRVQKVVLRLRAQKLSDQAVAELRAVFKSCDHDGSGEISVSLVREEIMKIACLRDSLEEIMRVLWTLEAGTGIVQFDKFIASMLDRYLALQKEACRAVFEVLDYDGGGTICREELRTALEVNLEGSIDHANATFVDGLKTVFGMSVDEVGKTFNDVNGDDSDEFTFDQFFEILLTSQKKGKT